MLQTMHADNLDITRLPTKADQPRVRVVNYTRGHFWSRDKDGRHTVRFTISSTEPDLLPTKLLHCGKREFRASSSSLLL